MKTLNIALAALALLTTSVAALRWRTVSRLRVEAAVASRAEQPINSAAASDGTDDEIAALREQTKDLPRLRNEVRQLRSATNEIAALQAENVRLTKAKESGAIIPAPVPPGFIGKEQLVDAGFATPDTTVQTFFWAMRETNFSRAMETWSEGMKQKQGLNDEKKRARLEAEFSKGTADMMRRFNNFGVIDREQPSPTKQVLHIRSSFATRVMKMQLVFEGNAWKIDDFD